MQAHATAGHPFCGCTLDGVFLPFIYTHALITLYMYCFQFYSLYVRYCQQADKQFPVTEKINKVVFDRVSDSYRR